MTLWQKYKSISPLWRWFFQFLVIMIFLALAFAPQRQSVDYSDVSFGSSANSRIYFHNVRSFYYHIDKRSKEPMLIYRLKRRVPERDSLSLNFDIIRHPASDDAFIYSYLGKGYAPEDSLELKFAAYEGREKLVNIRNENHFRIAAKTYISFINEEGVYLMQGSDTLKELFTDRAAYIDTEITLEDYFKLVQKG